MILKDNPFSTKHSLKIGDKIIDFSTPKIMGVINATPDSFFDGGINNSVQKAIDKAINMVFEGAEFLDVGGYSSRPGADDISVQEEIKRTVPVVRAIHERLPDVFIIELSILFSRDSSGMATLPDLSGCSRMESVGKASTG